MKDEADDFQERVTPNTFVDKIWIEIWIRSRTNPDIRKIFAREHVKNQLKRKGKNEGPTIDEKTPKFVIETAGVLDPEDEEVSGDNDEV